MSQNWKKVQTGGAISYVKAKELQERGITGEILQGYFKGTREGDYKGKTTYSHAFELVAPVQLDLDSPIEMEKGDKLVLNGVGSLNYQMGNVPEGELCRISYNGKKDVKGTLMHDFVVETAN